MALLDFRCRHPFSSGFQLDVAFESEHRFTTLFGPSGAGKTTILSIIAGFVTPREGYVRLGDRTLLDTDHRVSVPVKSRSVGVVFQDALLFPHLTVDANLRFGQRRRRKQKRVVDFGRVVEVLEVGGLLKRHPRNLSGGEKQRVALGRALLSGPELLLMDEPMASLDAPLKTRILAYLERVVIEWNIPTLYVSHSQAEVRRASDWVVILDQGRIVARGVPEDALGQPAPLGWSDSTRPMNLVRLDRVERTDGQLKGWIGSQLLSLPPQAPSGLLPRFAMFSPAHVFLSKQDLAGVSARNHLRGRVCRLATSNQAIFVAIDIGQIIWAEVTPAAANEMNLRAGDEVFCLLKAHGLSLVD
ncbi:MAG: molybdenum ABC transporter ATP-binding protein [Rhodopirellula sp.]|nr:molybdenum ABC transporter ATP-binding protein [Rhodopirellula sp.]